MCIQYVACCIVVDSEGQLPWYYSGACVYGNHLCARAASCLGADDPLHHRHLLSCSVQPYYASDEPPWGTRTQPGLPSRPTCELRLWLYTAKSSDARGNYVTYSMRGVRDKALKCCRSPGSWPNIFETTSQRSWRGVCVCLYM